MKRRSSFGWLELIVGVLFILLGIFTFLNPTTAIQVFILMGAFLAIFSGISDIVFYARLRKRLGYAPAMALVGGIINIVIGAFLIFMPGIGAFAVSILFAVWILVHCIVRLANLGYFKEILGTGVYWVTLILLILGLVLGVLLLVNPMVSILSLTYIIGALMILFGIGSIFTAFSPLGADDQW